MALAERWRNDERGHLLADHVLTPMLKQLLRGRVEVRDAALGVDDDDAIHRRLEDRGLSQLRLRSQRLALSSLDAEGDDVGHGGERGQRVVGEGGAREHSHHADEAALDEQRVTGEGDQPFSRGPRLIADPRIVLHVVREVRLSLLRDEPDLEAPDGDASVLAVEVLIETGARLQLERACIGGERPDPRERRVEVCDERLGTRAELLAERGGTGERRRDRGAELGGANARVELEGHLLRTATGLHFFRDVGEHGDRAGEHSVRVVDRRGAAEQRPVRVVEALEMRLLVQDGLALREAARHRPVAGFVGAAILVERAVLGPVLDARRRAASRPDLLRRTVVEHEATGGVAHDDAVRAVIEHCFEDAPLAPGEETQPLHLAPERFELELELLLVVHGAVRFRACRSPGVGAIIHRRGRTVLDRERGARGQLERVRAAPASRRA